MGIEQFIETLEKSNFTLAAENGKLILKGDKSRLTGEEIESMKKNQEIISYIRTHKDELIEYISTTSNSSPKKRSENISAMYPLSGLQEGMLFHGLYDEKGGAYIEQLKCILTNVQVDVFEKSWQYLLNRHSVLRTSFHYDAFRIPVQCVYRKVRMPLEVLDYRGMPEGAQREAIRLYEELDRQKGFVFEQAPLMRVGLLRLDEDRYHMVWTWHHIVVDGWSMPVLMEEFLTTYERLLQGKKVEKMEEDRYEDYIRYIERRDKEQEKRYWKSYMEGVEGPTLLPFINSTAGRNKGKGIYKEELLLLDRERTSKIEAYAQQQRITMNTVMQGVWSYVLHRYAGNKDVVFGVIVSGRPDAVLA